MEDYTWPCWQGVDTEFLSRKVHWNSQLWNLVGELAEKGICAPRNFSCSVFHTNTSTIGNERMGPSPKYAPACNSDFLCKLDKYKNTCVVFLAWLRVMWEIMPAKPILLQITFTSRFAHNVPAVTSYVESKCSSLMKPVPLFHFNWVGIKKGRKG